MYSDAKNNPGPGGSMSNYNNLAYVRRPLRMTDAEVKSFVLRWREANPERRALLPLLEAAEKPSVRFFRLRHGSGLPMPSYGTKNSAGIDLRAATREPHILHPGRSYVIATGFAVSIQEGWEGRLRGISGLVTTAAIISSDFRGEIVAELTNMGHETYTLNPGGIIMQLVIARVLQANITESPEAFSA